MARKSNAVLSILHVSTVLAACLLCSQSIRDHVLHSRHDTTYHVVSILSLCNTPIQPAVFSSRCISHASACEHSNVCRCGSKAPNSRHETVHIDKGLHFDIADFQPGIRVEVKTRCMPSEHNASDRGIHRQPSKSYVPYQRVEKLRQASGGGRWVQNGDNVP